MTTAPNATIATATPISMPRCEGPVPSCEVVSVISSSCLFVAVAHDLLRKPLHTFRDHARSAARERAARRAHAHAAMRRSGSIGGGEEARFLHQVAMAGLFLLDPLGVVSTRHEGLIERTVVHQLLPLRRLAHLLEQIDIEHAQ